MATSASIAAATSAVAGVAALVSKIENIFGKAKQVKDQAVTLFKKPGLPPTLPTTTRPPFPVQNANHSIPGRPFPMSVSRNEIVPQNTNNNAKPGFFSKHKTPILIGAGVLVVGTGIAIALKSGKKKSSKPISGTPRTRRKRKDPQRDELGRFTKGHTITKKRTSRKTRKAPEKLVPKALL